MSQRSRRLVLESQGLVHARPDEVTAALFNGGDAFFFASDKLQVKYEMLRAHVVDGCSITAAASDHGYSRASFYVIASAFEASGMAGLIDERPGRRGPVKMTEQIEAFVRAADADLSGAVVARLVEDRFGVSFHRRTIERARP